RGTQRLVFRVRTGEVIFSPPCTSRIIPVCSFLVLRSRSSTGRLTVFLEEVPWYSTLINTLVLLVSLFLILLVLIQRGKGGGLAGAFGGVGGSSAFGSRAGDLFTRITLVAAAVWVLLIMIHVRVVQPSGER